MPLLSRRAKYVVILKTLPGELAALRQARPATLDRVMPLIEIATKRGDAETTSAQRLLPKLAERLEESLGARPFFIDFPWLSLRTRVAIGKRKTSVGGIQHVLTEVLARGGRPIPVVRIGNVRRLQLIRQSMDLEAVGLCVRLRIRGVTASGNKDEIEALLDAAGISRASVDLILDMGFIEQEPGFVARDVYDQVQKIPELARYRSVALAGSTMPTTLTAVRENSVGTIQRHEFGLWRDVVALRPDAAIEYSDYAVQNPERPDATGPGMRANVRYTAPEYFVIARGTQVTLDGWDQYRHLAAQITKRPEFRGSGFSWGDDEIVRCAQGGTFTRSSPYWRGVATSHHIEQILDSLG
jgi:hypothetical protein